MDECEKFIDEQKLPTVLVQNKIDLVDEETQKNTDIIKEFQKKNEFDNFFRTSVKMGININETMNFLIENIIERMEKFSRKSGLPMGKNRRESILGKSNTMNYDTNIKLDSSRLISSSKRSSLKSKRSNQEGENNGVYDYMPGCCQY